MAASLTRLYFVLSLRAPLFILGNSALQQDLLQERFDNDEDALLQAQVHLLQVKLQTSPRIPRVLLLMGNENSIDELHTSVRANVQKAIELNNDLQLRWLSDAACNEYLEQHVELGLLEAFRSEKRGSFRGDICRAAVLSVEGGFYQDVDVELRVPFRDLISNSTSFLTLWEADGNALLNAVIAVEPRSALMTRTVEQIKEWYADPLSRPSGDWMGPATLTQAVKEVLKQDCPSVDLMQTRDHRQHDLSCGSHQLRVYQEQKLSCDSSIPNDRGCSPFDGLRFGFFGGTDSESLIGWPRFADCASFGCGGGGWDVKARDSSS
jgi:mannosyltransferase OCH1-like enzyme